MSTEKEEVDKLSNIVTNLEEWANQVIMDCKNLLKEEGTDSSKKIAENITILNDIIAKLNIMEGSAEDWMTHLRIEREQQRCRRILLKIDHLKGFFEDKKGKIIVEEVEELGCKATALEELATQVVRECKSLVNEKGTDSSKKIAENITILNNIIAKLNIFEGSAEDWMTHLRSEEHKRFCAHVINDIKFNKTWIEEKIKIIEEEEDDAPDAFAKKARIRSDMTQVLRRLHERVTLLETALRT